MQCRSCVTNYGVTKSDVKEVKNQFENAVKRKDDEKTPMMQMV